MKNLRLSLLYFFLHTFFTCLYFGNLNADLCSDLNQCPASHCLNISEQVRGESHALDLLNIRSGIPVSGPDGNACCCYYNQDNEGLTEILRNMNPEIRRVFLEAAGIAESNDFKKTAVKLTNLKFLTFHTWRVFDLGPDGIRRLAPALEKLVNLEALHLSENRLGPEGARYLAPALEKLVNLEALHLSENRLGPEGARYLAPALEKLINLKSLGLLSNHLGSEGTRHLAPAVAKLINLERLLDFYDGYSSGRHETDSLNTWIEELAEQGNSGAQYYLGLMHEKGHIKKAFEWFEKSAKTKMDHLREKDLNQLTPTLNTYLTYLNHLKGIKEFSLGYGHSLLLTDGGKVYSWG